jgi:hypothetical protein
MDKDGELIWEAYGDMAIPSVGSHEKGKAMELIQLYTAMMESEQELSREVFLNTLKDRWIEFMEDPDIDDDQVLHHVMDQTDALPAGAEPLILSAYRDAKGEMP